MSIQVLDGEKVYLGSAEPSSGGGGQTINNEDITITENGIYTADEGYTGIGTATVNVTPQLTTLNATTNGTYTPESPNVGYSSVVVNTPSADVVSAKNATGSSIESGSKVWLEKKAGGGTRDFSVSGTYTLNDDNGIITFLNYSGSAGKTYATDFTTPSEYIEVQIKLQANLGYNNAAVSDGLTEFFGGYYTGSIRISANESTDNSYGGLKYSVYGLTSGTLVSAAAFKMNHWYWVKIRITNTTMTPYWSEDGQTWNQGTVYSGSNLLASFTSAANSSKYIGIRSQYNSSRVYIGGVADLTETYVKADDTYWWRPYLDTQVGWNIMPYSFSSANSFTGTATQNVASSATGDVKTVLPETITVTVTSNADNAEISVE